MRPRAGRSTFVATCADRRIFPSTAAQVQLDIWSGISVRTEDVLEPVRQRWRNGFESPGCKYRTGKTSRVKRPAKPSRPLGFGPEVVAGPSAAPSADVPGAEAETEAEAQLHFPCMRFVRRSSRHLSHCETGLPFFLTSKSGRSVCWQPDERWPLMHDSLPRTFSWPASLYSLAVGDAPCELLVVYEDLA